MNQKTKDRQRRALRAQLLQTYTQMAETPADDVEKLADYRLKTFRIQKQLKKVDNPVDSREYVTRGSLVGHCMNCEVPISRYNILKVEDNGSMFCCDGCRVHYDEFCGHKKAAASRERNRLSNTLTKSINVILSNNEPQGKLG